MTEKELFKDTYSNIRAPESCREAVFALTEKRRRVRGPLRTAAMALAAVLILTLAALAVGDGSFSALPEGLRRLWGIESEAVPEYIAYENVEYLEGCNWTDVDRSGDGELYISASQSARTERLFTVSVSAIHIPAEQVEDYVWRFELEDGGWAEAVPVLEERGLLIWFRVTFHLSAEDEQPFRVRLCAGYESGDGRTFSVARRSEWLRVEPGAGRPAVRVSFGEGVPMERAGIRGTLTLIEFTDELMLCHFNAEGANDIYWGYRNNMRDRQAFDRYLCLMELPTGLIREDFRINSSDGSELTPRRSEEVGAVFEDDSCLTRFYFKEPIDTTLIESVTIKGVTYPIDAG